MAGECGEDQEARLLPPSPSLLLSFSLPFFPLLGPRGSKEAVAGLVATEFLWSAFAVMAAFGLAQAITGDVEERTRRPEWQWVGAVLGWVAAILSVVAVVDGTVNGFNDRTPYFMTGASLTGIAAPLVFGIGTDMY